MDRTSRRWRRSKNNGSQQTLFADKGADVAATSRAAAHAVQPHTESQRDRILQFVAECLEFGATADEICNRLGMLPQSVTPRLGELARDGEIVRTGRKRATR